MGTLLNRRRYMGGCEPVVEGELLYWWCGLDAPVNEAWVDRINSVELKAEHHASYDGIAHETDHYVLGWDTPHKTQLKGSLRDISMGRHWKIIIDFTELLGNSKGSNYMIDFGSFQSTSRNFAISRGSSTLAGDGLFQDNYKGISNNTQNNYGVQGASQPLRRIIRQNVRMLLEYGCEAYDSTQDIQYVRANNGEKVYAPNPHEPVSFNANDWNKTELWVGRCVAYSNPSAFDLYDMKIYGLDNV